MSSCRADRGAVVGAPFAWEALAWGVLAWEPLASLVWLCLGAGAAVPLAGG
jgi:hypothetical protein